jgi:predicted MFS family arabinose efflux permease
MSLSKNAAFYLQASIILFFLAGSSAPTPLYAVYQSMWGFSPITVTVIFGVYALAVLAALLVFGSLSDYVGRRPVLFAATLLQAATMLLFAHASGVGSLLVARIAQGLATGAAAGAVGAGMLDLDRQRGTVANAIGPMLGTATGGMLSGIMIQYLPAPTKLVYLVLGVIFIAQAVGVAFMPESVTRRAGALGSLRPHFQLPAAVRAPFLLALPVLIASWALAGFYGSLGPSLVRRLIGSSSLLFGGLTLFLLAGSGVVTVLVTQTRSARSVMSLGSAALALGVASTVVAISQPSIGLFFLGTIVAGAGFGAGFQGAIRSILPLALPHERAGVLSILYVVAYVSMGLPAVLGGLRAAHGGGLFTTAREYGEAVVLLALSALLGALLHRPGAAAPASGVSQASRGR